MMRTDIRAARPEDAGEMARVQLESWRVTYPGIMPDSYLDAMPHDEYESFWKRSLSEEPDGRVFYVAEDEEGGISGFSSGGPGREPPHDGLDSELYTIYVAPGRGGGGTGGRLFRAVASGLSDLGCRNMYLWVMAKNDAARRFYERLDGRECGESIFTVDGEDIVEVAYEWRDLVTLTGAG